MEKKTLWEKICYKYEYLGQVEKEGRTYKKYKKTSRFLMLKKNTVIVLIILILLLTLVIFDWIVTSFAVKK